MNPIPHLIIVMTLSLLSAILLGAVITQKRESRSTWRQLIVPITLMTCIVALALEPTIAVIDALIVLVAVTRLAHQLADTTREALINHWPEVLDELHTRVASLGEAAPTALFASAAGFPPDLAARFDRHHDEYVLTGDLVNSIDRLACSLPDDPSRETLLAIAHVCQRGSTEAASTFRALRDQSTKRRQLHNELAARMSGARLARAFIIAVPTSLLVLGIAIGGGIVAYGTTLGLALLTAAILLIAACWAWSSHLLRPLSPTPPSSRQIPRWFNQLYFGHS
ncbi:MAG: hypothetical protein ACYDHP_04965 [Ferrimicrobium sp.]